MIHHEAVPELEEQRRLGEFEKEAQCVREQ